MSSGVACARAMVIRQAFRCAALCARPHLFLGGDDFTLALRLGVLLHNALVLLAGGGSKIQNV